MLRHLSVALMILVAGCGGRTERSADPMVRDGANAVQTATPIGLYESGPPSPPSQLCLVERAPGDLRFGLVVRGADGRICSGAGRAIGKDGALRLEMTGDAPCTIQPVVRGRLLDFPATLPAECAYYCGAGASMAAARFVKAGGTSSEALRARDLVGDALCEASAD